MPFSLLRSVVSQQPAISRVRFPLLLQLGLRRSKRMGARQASRLVSCALLLGLLSCDRREDSHEQRKESTPSPPDGPMQLYLPEHSAEPNDPEHTVDLSTAEQEGAPVVPMAGGPCPSDMVFVAGALCIDRYEVSLVDVAKNRFLSPHFPPTRKYTSFLFQQWSGRAPSSGRSLGRSLPVPDPPDFQLKEEFEPKAQSIAGVIPAGYLTRGFSETACENAGKRLCTRDEWVMACRGQEDRLFPYGEIYREGVCNVHRANHPASLLHGDASRNHMDPRLGLTQDDDGPLLRRTGATPECVSRWGADAIYDMVGNLDEWIADPTGTFVGGFYSRATRNGCEASIESHAPDYLDYSLGTRCCRAPGG